MAYFLNTLKSTYDTSLKLERVLISTNASYTPRLHKPNAIIILKTLS